MGKLGKKARKFAKKNLQSVLRMKRKYKAMKKRKTASVDHRGNVEKYDALSSEEQSKWKSGDTTVDVAASNNSLDNIYIEDDVDLVEDESDNEGILSEDPECPYISDIELESNGEDDCERAALSESNKNIHMEIVEQKRKLERLLEKVPKFSNFLESRRAELQESKNEEIDSDEEGDTNYSNGVSVNEDMHLHDRRAINSCTIDVWCWLVLQQPEGPALPNLLNAFQAACRYGLDSDESRLHDIPDKKVFSKVLMFILCEADGIFRKWLGVSDSCNKDRFLKLANTSEWKSARPLMKSYLRSCLLLLNQVTDGQILVFILGRLRSSVVFFTAFPSLSEMLIKISVHLWVTGEEGLSLSSFLVMREIASKLLSDWYHTCLTKTYKAFIGHSKFFEPGNLKQIEFLKNSIVELHSLDLQRSYQHVLASLQQLANILNQSMKTTEKEGLKNIHNWQYINCISLWVKYIDCNIKDHDLQPLLPLAILIIKGIAHLFPGLRYLPLRFRCVQMLNQLSFSSGVFIPVASLLFDCLDHKEFTADATRVKPFDFSTVLKVPKHFLKSRNFQEEKKKAMNKHQEEHEVYGGEIADVADMEGEEEMPVAPHFSKEESLDDMKKRLRHIEDEASALRELHARVEKEMGVAQDDSSSAATTQAEKEEVDSRSIYVGNVDYACTPEELQQHFQSCGTVNRVTILTDKFGQPKGFAYVEFVEVEAVQNAILLNESELHGRQLKVSAKRTNIPGMKQYRGRQHNPYMAFRSRRPFTPSPYYAPYGYGKAPRFRRPTRYWPY